MTYRISELDIEDVKRLKEKGLSQTIIAQRLNVSKVWICRKFKEIKNEKQSEGDSGEGKTETGSGSGVLRSEVQM